MADQASVRGAGDPRVASATRYGQVGGDAHGNGNGNGVVSRITGLGNDLFTLAELQFQLLALDLKACVEKARVSAAAVGIGAVILLSAVPVALLGIADLVAYALNIRAGWAMLITAAVAAALAGAILFAFGRRTAESLTTFRRSREEFSRNIAWVRTVVLYSGRSYPKRGR
jgi:hypothetical protein